MIDDLRIVACFGKPGVVMIDGEIAAIIPADIPPWLLERLGDLRIGEEDADEIDSLRDDLADAEAKIADLKANLASASGKIREAERRADRLERYADAMFQQKNKLVLTLHVIEAQIGRGDLVSALEIVQKTLSEAVA